MLTRQRLTRLEHAWQRQGAPLIDHLRPGLAPDQIDELTAPLGLELPAEARTWWGWHDGVSVELTARFHLGPSLPFFSLEQAASLCRRFREQALRVWGERADEWWRPSWFPITDRVGAIRCECAVAHGAETPIYWADSHDYDAEGLTTPKVDSFGTMVDWWLEALDAGAWSYDREAGRWQRDSQAVPPGRTALV